MVNLLSPHTLGGKISLKNRVVMAPMTRARTSEGDVPTALMAQYYGQRASAGLIITEAVDVSPYSKGYARTPGLYSQAQIQGWRRVTDEVHRDAGRIFAQLWHVGRMAHTSLMPNGEAPWGVTDEAASESDVFAYDAEGKATFVRASQPRQMTLEDVSHVVNEFAQAAKNADAAGFDGVEIHGANGYLVDQFTNSALNTRTDSYGGQTLESRTRFLLEVVDAAAAVLGPDRVGVRLSPFGRFNSMPEDPKVEETLLYLCAQLDRRNIAYVHLVYQLMPSGNMNSSDFNQHHLSDALVQNIRSLYKGTIIWCGGFDKVSGKAALDTWNVDLIAFGRPFVGNPDLVERFQNNWPVIEADPSSYYTRNGAVGYTDFPGYESLQVS
ncbi:alkene reductase [Pseudomonas sp. NPDC086251]|jgi:N-ethylmaleimide reductase|uniref:alkene reductase n=1 Tax=Pseudomonas sp. NPDC086251 TaxID=3364431 RepID=UPI003832E306